MAALSASLAGVFGTEYTSERVEGDAEGCAGELVRSIVSTSSKVLLALLFLFFFVLDLGVVISSVPGGSGK